MPKHEGIEVTSRKGRHFIKMQDLLNHPSTVRDDILPQYGELFVTRFGEVCLRITVPELSDLMDFDEY